MTGGTEVAVAVSGGVSVVASDVRSPGADPAVDVDRWAELAQGVLVAEGAVGELTLTFVDADEIAELHREHLGRDGPTDVLSFPLDEAAPSTTSWRCWWCTACCTCSDTTTPSPRRPR